MSFNNRSIGQSVQMIDHEIEKATITQLLRDIEIATPLLQRFHQMHQTESAQLAPDAVSEMRRVLREMLSELIEGERHEE